MKCLNCGNETDSFLCNNCHNEEILEKIFNQIMFYKEENCDNLFVNNYVKNFENKYEARNGIPNILNLFDSSVADFWYCRYYKIIRNKDYEEIAIKYLNSHNDMDIKKQRIMFDLLSFYIPNYFVKPYKWCEIISNTDNLCLELYNIAAEFYSMVGDYDISEEIINKAMNYCNNINYDKFLFSNKDKMIEELTKRSNLLERYRNGKPYWPIIESRRIALAPIYDKKGIEHDRITLTPKPIKENEFLPIKEAEDECYYDYCAFWCSGVNNYSGNACIYQIAAIKVRNGNIIDKFQRYICPWDGRKPREMAAKKANVGIEIILKAKNVDQVMYDFFKFVGNDILVSTDALGSQAKLISRAARYSGMREITNYFFDLLDYAAEISIDFDKKNNTRDYLLEYFSLKEGKDSIEKAERNIEIYDKLKKMGE